MVWQRPFMPHEDHQHGSTALPDGVITMNTPKGANEIMIQALTQSIRYTLDGTDPTSTSGFQLTAGNDPIVISVMGGRTTLKFYRAASGAILEHQWGL